MSSYSITLGKRTEQNPYTADLEAMKTALERIPPETCQRWISLLSSNRSALAANRQPRQQSGQETIQQIYKQIQSLQQRGNAVNAIWIPAHTDINLRQRAKAEARKSMDMKRIPEKQPFQAKSTALRLTLTEQQQEWILPADIGKYSKGHRYLFQETHKNLIRWNEPERGKNLVQLRTGKTRLNSYLNKIGAAEFDICACGQASETMEHFLFRCTRWTTTRGGGKSRSDPDLWQPDMKTVHAVINYAIATGRLEQKLESEP
ncbi:hypothetical protein TSTA_109270 [Talaromyces stipitatus ATCC 10500]|uniref:Uncharacterized protein n=1 Tax=Talaromyces stipitatus (strain ATCC 10500 / CBS 375.48 / QM 6759 / NRRL 1006) TaxID=441959 RepID=B8MV32_TALSN|nr:uncharacterized protein TSTA_109270 [Talaromyces stipitatus ATCC 10500]EED11748.1 hypothetical protein TSTA_109270 [Talaromyces stipitatus ATCC 10500]